MIVVENEYIFNFDANNKPVAYCKPNDIVQFVTDDCFCSMIKTEKDMVNELDSRFSNPATGPLYVETADVNDVLAVDILDIEVADTGVTSTIEPLGCMWDGCQQRTKIIKIKDGLAYFNDVTFPIEPMIGVIGTCSDEYVVTEDSFNCGGNMDSRIITKGVTVYLPVKTKGALLAIGDLHASMGDGEVCETGIEIKGKVTVRVRVIKNFSLNWPVTETKDEWYVNTNGNTADKAIKQGYKELARLVMNAYNWDYTDTVMYLSLQARICANQACLNPHEKDSEGPTFRVGIVKNHQKPRLID